MTINALKETASQTAGPYIHIGCTPSFAGLKNMYNGRDLGANMVNEYTLGERIHIRGKVIDGNEELVRDAILEAWQSDHAGLFNSPQESRGIADPNFTNWGRYTIHPATGHFEFETVRPGRVPYHDGRLQAPFIHFWIVARGINLGLHTRMYFCDEEAANQEDPVLQLINNSSHKATLIAAKTPTEFHFDIRLQGINETVFFAV